ncbi:MAG: hypothetical protein H7144_01410 [Burkholderiales bacterium]|nr:hypothetical protein [Phycisphaerae bacterium]
MVETTAGFPPMPEIGLPESAYAQMAKQAEREGNEHARAAAKVGQYVTLAMDRSLDWDQKLRYFKHTLSRHCFPPRFAGDKCWTFYHNLADVVREYCGREALRIASTEDDLYASRLDMGQLREKIEAEAEAFFDKLMGGFTDCPEHYDQEDWAQLKLIRDQWI